MKEIGIVLADDHAVLREGLAALIDRQEDMVVLGQAADGAEAVDLCAATKPAVAVIDLSMPKLGGLEAIAAISEISPKTRVVVLTMHDTPRHLRSALAAGASGYVVKELASREILEAIRAADSGQVFVRMSIANDVLDESETGEARKRRGVPEVTLSKREREVLYLIARGYTNKEAAEALGVGKKSIDSYRARLQQKLELSRRSDLVRYALDTGVLSSDADEDDPALKR